MGKYFVILMIWGMGIFRYSIFFRKILLQCQKHCNRIRITALANYFGVGIDKIIGMDEIASSQKLDQINHKWEENRQKVNHLKNVAMAALESLTCSMVFYLKTLGEIEENPGYKPKISLIIVIFFMEMKVI